MNKGIFDLAEELFCQARNSLSQEGGISPVAFIVRVNEVESISVVSAKEDSTRDEFYEWLKTRCRERDDVRGLIVIADNWYVVNPGREAIEQALIQKKIDNDPARREGLGLEIYTKRYCRIYRWLYRRTDNGVVFDREGQEVQSHFMVDVSSNIDPWPNRGGMAV